MRSFFTVIPMVLFSLGSLLLFGLLSFSGKLPIALGFFLMVVICIVGIGFVARELGRPREPSESQPSGSGSG